MTTDNITAVLTQEGVDAEFAKLHALAESLRSKTGTFAQRRKDAALTALGVSVKLTPGEDVPAGLANMLAILKNLTSSKSDGVQLGAFATALASVNEWAAHTHGEATGSVLKAQGGGESELTTLREQFDAQKTRCEALLAVAQVIPGMDKLVAQHTIPAGTQFRRPRGASTGTKSTGKKFSTFYRILPNGEKRYQGESQDKFSSVAWFYGAAIMGKPGSGDANSGKGVATATLEDFLRSKGIDSPQGKPWEYVVDLGDGQQVTFGMETVGDDSKDSEEE